MCKLISDRAKWIHSICGLPQVTSLTTAGSFALQRVHRSSKDKAERPAHKESGVGGGLITCEREMPGREEVQKKVQVEMEARETRWRRSSERERRAEARCPAGRARARRGVNNHAQLEPEPATMQIEYAARFTLARRGACMIWRDRGVRPIIFACDAKIGSCPGRRSPSWQRARIS